MKLARDKNCDIAFTPMPQVQTVCPDGMSNRVSGILVKACKIVVPSQRARPAILREH